MKEQGAPQLELLKAVEELKQRRKTLEQKVRCSVESCMP